MKVRRKFDVVTKQGMVVVPKLKDLGGSIEAVSVAEEGFSARLSEGGNILIDYSGNEFNTKKLNIGTLTLMLKLSDVEEPFTYKLTNVKAKKSTPKVKAAGITIPAKLEAADGIVIGTTNILCSCKLSSGQIMTLRPEKAELIGTPKGISVKPNENDPTELDIYSISKKSTSFKVKLNFAGGVTKTVTVKVKKK